MKKASLHSITRKLDRLLNEVAALRTTLKTLRTVVDETNRARTRSKAAQYKAVKTTTTQLQSLYARKKLAPQTRAYFIRIGKSAWLGYRKRLSGPGSWVVRVGFSTGTGWEKTFAIADDDGKADGVKVLTFFQAKIEAQNVAAAPPVKKRKLTPRMALH